MQLTVTQLRQIDVNDILAKMVKKKEFNPKVQWAKFIVVLILYLLFLYWVGSWWGLLVIPFIFDVYITKKIKWQWWKESEKPVKFLMSWVDALVFALVAVYFINLFFFQNYVIPSSSLEKSLLTGDYLFVSKVSYGPRIPQTPLTMPLTQHTLPVVECKSYIDWPHWDYRRVKGFRIWAGGAQRYCCVQLPSWRHTLFCPSVSGLRLLPDVLWYRLSVISEPS